MRAVLPGRPQATRQALCTTNWDGLRLVAYVSGKTAILFNGQREILQSITVDDCDSLKAVVIEERSGQVALASTTTTYIYKPVGRDYGDLHWVQAYRLQAKDDQTVTYISWGSESEIVVAGTVLSLWNISEGSKPAVIWSSPLANEVAVAEFSNDAGIIASCGHHDRLVKIWRRLSYEYDGTRFDVSFLPHPSAVTNLQWREPWHTEQNLENLLYTFCADKHVRAWAYSDPHAAAAMQQVATIDTSTSIQPRRLSVSTESTDRYVFVLNSRDISRATERAVQHSHSGSGHALEHLIEIANRSPELCIILDAVGHMSVLGLENAGYKNKMPTETFNVALVDGVDITLPFHNDTSDDYIQICAFANSDAAASLCILVHSYSGKIDWYQGSIVDFLDTSRNLSRTKLLSSWSGHDSTVERIKRGSLGNQYVSWTNENDLIVWAQSAEGALIKLAEAETSHEIIDACLLEAERLLIVAHTDSMTLWSTKQGSAELVFEADLGLDDGTKPSSIRLHSISGPSSAYVILLCTDGQSECWQANYPRETERKQLNGSFEPLQYVASLADKCLETCSVVVQSSRDGDLCLYGRALNSLLSWNCGQLTIYGIKSLGSENPSYSPRFQSDIPLRDIGTAYLLFEDTVVLVSEDGFNVYIWNVKLGCLDYSVTFDDRIEKVEGTMDLHGVLAIAIMFSFKITVFMQGRFEGEANSKPWGQRIDIRTRDYTVLAISDICWSQSFELILAAGNQLLVLDTSKIRSSHEGQAKWPEQNIAAVLALRNCEVEIFHPNFLNNILLHQEEEYAVSIFESLYRELKFLVGEERLSSYLGDSPQRFVNHSSSSRSRVEKEEDSFEEIRESLLEFIHSIPTTQLSAKEKAELAAVLNAFAALTAVRRSVDSSALLYMHHLHICDPSTPLPLPSAVHALLSTTPDPLYELTMNYLTRLDTNFKLTFAPSRALHIPLWLSSETLKSTTETIARTSYAASSIVPDDLTTRSPISASIFLLALQQKQLLLSLWRTTMSVPEKVGTMRLLQNNFTEEKWKHTASKNAYALLSKRRFEYGAAWFLLAGRVRDAVGVCVDRSRVDDVELGILLARVWNGRDDKEIKEGEQVMEWLRNDVVKHAAVRTTEARWWGVWSCAIVNDWAGAIRYVVDKIEVLFKNEIEAWRQERQRDGLEDAVPECMMWQAQQPTELLVVFKTLREKLVAKEEWTEDVLSYEDEWAFVMRCVRFYMRSGMSLLAARLVRNWKFVPRQKPVKLVHDEGKVEGLPDEDEDNDGREQRKNEMTSLVPQESKKEKPAPTQFLEPSADSLLDSFGF